MYFNARKRKGRFFEMMHNWPSVNVQVRHCRCSAACAVLIYLRFCCGQPHVEDHLTLSGLPQAASL